jgi:two-component system cell cycle sensor histidine kinase/response regulator CckA
MTGPADARAGDAAEEAARTASETVLLVEDEPAVRRLSVKVLRDQGYTVLEADSPARALELAQEHDEAVHLVVSDVVMPGLSGPDLLARLRQRWPDLRALFVSGYTESAVVRQGVLEPGTPFLAKPFSPAALSRRVREVLESKP